MELAIEKAKSGVRWVAVKRENFTMEGETSEGGISHLSENRGEVGHPSELVIPWMMAEAETTEWWKGLKGNPKRSGEISQAAFLLKARTMGFSVALPWGDSERYDFMVRASDGGRILRVQVKATGRLHRRGYEVQPVHATRGQGKKRYTAGEIDVLAAHVQPVDVWYLLPIRTIGRAGSLRFYPDIECRGARWERYREAWDVLRDEG